MKTIFRDNEKGQTLVWVALGLVVLLMAVALAVDVGSMYSERRHMQNAADAAALEAARLRCYDNKTAEQAAAGGELFGETNYQRPDATVAITVTTRDAGWEFVSTAAENMQLTFARVFTSGSTVVAAQAAAACGPVEGACGMFPLAFDQSTWDDISSRCGQKFYVWTSEYDREKTPAPGTPTPYPVSCFDPANPNGTTQSCNCNAVYETPKWGTPVPGAIALAGAGRAWLDFTSAASQMNPVDCGGSNGCGQAEISCWIRSDSRVVLLENTCVSGTNGIKWGAKNAIADRVNDYVNVPLYDGRCTPQPSGAACDTNGFNISGYGCVRVEPLDAGNASVQLMWAQTPVPTAQGGKPYCDASDTSANCAPCVEGKMVPVSVGCDKCTTDCGKTSGGGNPGSGLKSISLIPIGP